MPTFTTSCPRNCYSTCSMQVEVTDGRIRRIHAHPDNLAAPEGVCLKGLSYAERVVSPDRILHPLARNAKTGEFHRVSWEEALDRIAGHLVRLRRDPGPQSVLYYASSGTKGLLNRLGAAFWRLYGGYTTTYGDLCWPAGLEAGRLTLGKNIHNAPWDLVHARLIVFWGKNAAETNIHQMRFVEQAQREGAKLVVIDPRRTQTAERADLILQPRPGTDGALALALAGWLIEHDRVDREFIARHVAGFEAFAEAAAAMTVPRAARICGIPEASIERLAEWLGTVKPATISAGYGMQRYTNSGQAMRAMIALTAITGNLGKPGAGWQFANLSTAIFDEVVDPLAFYPPEHPDGVARVSISTARLGRDMLAAHDPGLRMLWVERGNPVPQNPETNTVLDAFRRLEFRVVVDQFLTDTAREADLVLPAKTFAEQTDVIGAYWHPYLQIRQRIIDPPGEVKPESEIYRLLALRLGFDPAMIAETFPGPEDAAIDAWLERRLAPFPEVTLDRLRRGPVLAPGYAEIAFADGVYPTPSGKIELVSEEARERWGVDVVPRYTVPTESALHGLSEAGDRRSPRPTPYPLQLLTPNTKNRIHSQFNNLRMIRAVSPAPFAQVHPVDAAERGIADGDPVRLFNDRGEFTVSARLDHGIRPGCVAVTNGWWISDGGAVNLTSLGRETDLGHGAAFHDNLVQIEKAR